MNKLQELAEKAYMDISTSKGSEQSKKEALAEYFAEYAKLYLIGKGKCNPCDNCMNPNQMSDKRCLRCSAIDGVNNRHMLIISRIDQDLNQLQNE